MVELIILVGVAAFLYFIVYPRIMAAQKRKKGRNSGGVSGNDLPTDTRDTAGDQE